MSEVNPNDKSFFIRDVRLSFPDLFVARQYEGAGEFKYAATFLVDPGSDNDKAIRAAIQRAAVAKWGEKAAANLATVEGQSQKYCYLDGRTKAYDGYAGKWALSAKRYQSDGPVKVIDKDLRPIDATEGRIYGGCIVTAKVEVWIQENNWGKGVRCTLIGVQFRADGESFGGAAPANTDGFEAEESEEALF